MNKTIPGPAAHILNFLGTVEAPRGYDTIYGNNQGKLARPITKMTLKEVLESQPGWSSRFRSSATGRYQFMHNTLMGLAKEFDLKAEQIFDADFQDWLGYELLLRRGYDNWMRGKMSDFQFALNLAKEWASMPVLGNVQGAHRLLTRGQSYYEGDALNKSLVKPERLEQVLAEAKKMPATVEKTMTTGNFNPMSILTGIIRSGVGMAAADPTNSLAPEDAGKVTGTILDRIAADPRIGNLVGTEPKSPAASVTIWGVVLSAALKVASMFVPWIDPGWANTIMQYAPLLLSFGGDAMAVIGRFRAKQPLGSK